MRVLTTLFFLSLLLLKPSMANNAYDYNFTSINEEDVINLSDYKGKTIVVVNTASLCGFTYQYEGLQSLYSEYKDDGLIVIGVPSNQFLQEEPGDSKQIKEFCESTFGITFPMTVKNNVRGPNAHPFYKWAKDELGFIAGVPRWNFHKIIIDKNGNAAAGFTPLTKPSSKKFIKKIEDLLSS